MAPSPADIIRGIFFAATCAFMSLSRLSRRFAGKWIYKGDMECADVYTAAAASKIKRGALGSGGVAVFDDKASEAGASTGTREIEWNNVDGGDFGFYVRISACGIGGKATVYVNDDCAGDITFGSARLARADTAALVTGCEAGCCWLSDHPDPCCEWGCEWANLLSIDCNIKLRPGTDNTIVLRFFGSTNKGTKVQTHTQYYQSLNTHNIIKIVSEKHPTYIHIIDSQRFPRFHQTKV